MEEIFKHPTNRQIEILSHHDHNHTTARVGPHPRPLTMENIFEKPLNRQINVLKEIHKYMTAAATMEALDIDRDAEFTPHTTLDKTVAQCFGDACRAKASCIQADKKDAVSRKIKELEALQAREAEFDRLESECESLTQQTKIVRRLTKRKAEVDEDGLLQESVERLLETHQRKSALQALTKRADGVATLCKKIKTGEDRSM